MHAALRAVWALTSDEDKAKVWGGVQEELIKTLELDEGGCRLEDAIQGAEMLRRWDANDGVVADYKAKAAERWPEATAFH